MTTFAQPFQDYEILDRVGGGAMGTVFKARHKKLGRIVALKVLKPSLARDRRYVDRLRREARIVASLSHPNIVTGYDLGEEGGYHFFVMEFVEGKSLRQLLLEWGMFAEAYVLKVARQVAEALDHAYQRGVIHRDIKPGNILIDDAGSVKLTDMGLAKGPADLSLTRDGATVGTPMYISPEQARNPQDVDVRSDLYSLGATLYHMATGVPPFRGETMAALITSVLNDNVVPPDEANSAVSAPVSLVIRKLLAKNLTVRYQTPRELLDDLDRIERSQPPAVDVRRLDQREDAAPWQRWLLYGVATLMLCGFAWWGGQQMVAPAAPEVSSEQFLRQLDAELAALATPGARYERLRTITAPAPGSLLGLEQRRRSAQLELQQAVDAVIDALQTGRRPQVAAWLRDRSVWPDLQQFELRFLEPDLQAAAGLPLAQLLGLVRTQRLDELRHTVVRELELRDAQFASDFEQFLGTRLPALAEDRLRVGDFAAAERLWRDGLSFFCDGLQQPLPERLSEVVRRGLRERHLVAWRAASVDIERAELAVTTALRNEVEQTVQALGERLDDGVDAALVVEALQRFRDDLLHYWPPTSSFRVGHDPWPDVEQALRATQQRIDLAVVAALARHCERRCDLAWRAFCRGRGVDALAVLDGCEPASDDQQRELAAHRRHLDAAVRVEQALLTTIARARIRPVGFLLSGDTAAIELSVAADGEALRLVGQVVGQGPRAMRLSELRLADLLDRLAALDDAPLREMPSTPRALGLAALRLVGEDLDGIGRLLGAMPPADRAFLEDEVWPRIERARAAAGVDPLDPRRLFANLEQALADVEQTGAVEGLRGALLACNQLGEEQCTTAELRLRRQAGERLKLAMRQLDVAEELRRTAPRGALVDVRVEQRDIVAGVTLPAEVLRGDVGDGWQQRDDLLQFAGGARPWSEQSHLALVANAGFGVDVDRAVALVDVVFPSSRVGRRLYLLRFRGIGLAIALTAGDAIHVALVDGDALREDRAQRAFESAVSGGFAPARKLVVPGGVHRLKFEVDVLASGTQASVRVELEGVELLANQLHEVDRSLPPVLFLHPLQEIAVQKVTLQALDRQ